MQRPDIGCILHRSALVSFTGRAQLYNFTVRLGGRGGGGGDKFSDTQNYFPGYQHHQNCFWQKWSDTKPLDPNWMPVVQNSTLQCGALKIDAFFSFSHFSLCGKGPQIGRVCEKSLQKRALKRRA